MLRFGIYAGVITAAAGFELDAELIKRQAKEDAVKIEQESTMLNSVDRKSVV